MRRRLVLLMLAAACRTPPSIPPEPAPRPVEPKSAHVEPPATPAALGALIIAGERVAVDLPIVLWTDRGGHSMYGPGPEGALRYRPGRELASHPSDRARPSEAVDLFVIHYDACGTARRCAEILEQRGLSVHFLLDLDGTLYQALDLADTAWHARQANPRSIGIEIANIGAYPPGEDEVLERWYARDERGTRVTLPPELGDGGLRTPHFVARPARPEPIRGEIQELELAMYDLTPEQYDTLARLASELARIFPKIACAAPRGPDGVVLERALSDEELASFRGILGHCHVSSDKYDPGPAFDWEPFLIRVRSQALLRRAPPRGGQRVKATAARSEEVPR